MAWYDDIPEAKGAGKKAAAPAAPTAPGGIPAKGGDWYAGLDQPKVGGNAAADLLQEQSTMPDVYDPTAGMGASERLLVGTGAGMHSFGQGVGERMGLVSPEEVARTRQIDAPLRDTFAGKLGINLGQALPLAAAGPASWYGRAAIGAGTGALQPTAPGESVGINTAIGAGTALGLPPLLQAGGKGLSKLASAAAERAGQLAPQRAAAEAARAQGFSVDPRVGGGNWLSNILGWLAGEGNVAKAQASANLPAVARTAAADVGAPANQALTPEFLNDLRQQVADTYYAPIRELPGTVKPSQGLTDMLLPEGRVQVAGGKGGKYTSVAEKEGAQVKVGPTASPGYTGVANQTGTSGYTGAPAAAAGRTAVPGSTSPGYTGLARAPGEQVQVQLPRAPGYAGKGRMQADFAGEVEKTVPGLKPTFAKDAYGNTSQTPSLPEMTPAETLDAIGKLRARATEYAREHGQSGATKANDMAKQLRTLADEMENNLGQHLQATGRGDLLPGYQQGRQLIAKTHDIGEAADQFGVVDPAKLAQREASGRVGAKDASLTGGLKTIADVQRLRPPASIAAHEGELGGLTPENFARYPFAKLLASRFGQSAGFTNPWVTPYGLRSAGQALPHASALATPLTDALLRSMLQVPPRNQGQ